MPDLRLGNVFQLPSRRISRRWTRSGTNLVIFLGALCAQTNLFWREMKIKKMYLKSNTRQENFRTFEQGDISNGIKSDQLPAEKTSQPAQQASRGVRGKREGSRGSLSFPLFRAFFPSALSPLFEPPTQAENIPAWDCTSSKKPLCPLMSSEVSWERCYIKDFSPRIRNQPLWCSGTVQARRTGSAGFDSYSVTYLFFRFLSCWFLQIYT